MAPVVRWSALFLLVLLVLRGGAEPGARAESAATAAQAPGSAPAGRDTLEAYSPAPESRERGTGNAGATGTGGTTGWPWRATSDLGARVESLDPDLARYFGVAAGSGALLVAVAPGGAAAAAGLKSGDVLIRFGAAPIRSPADLSAALRAHAPGARVTATVVRHGREEERTVVLGAISALDQLLAELCLEREDVDSVLADLRAQLGGGEERMQARLKRLTELMRRMEERVDALVEQARP